MSLPVYPQYRQGEYLWLGTVPSHWRSKKIKHIAQFSGGGTPNRENLNYWGGNIPWVSPKDMKLERIEGAEECITLAGLQESTSNLIASGQALIVVRSGILKHTIPVAINAVEVSINQDMKALAFDQKLCDSRFFLRWVQGLNNELLLAWAKQGATVESIEHAYLAETLIPLPPLEEQHSIVAFLDHETAKIDALIAEQEKLLDLLAQKRQATISHAVTRGLNPDLPMKDSGVEWLGMVPAHWKVTPLKYLVSLKSGGTPSKENLNYWDGDIPWASAKDLKVELLADTVDHITEYAVEAGVASLVPSGAILVVVRGMILARTFPVVQTLAAMAINQDLKAILPNENLSANFLGWLLRGSESESLQRLDEAGHGTKALRMDAWTSMRLPVPPIEEQADIAKFIEQETVKLDCLKAEAERTIRLLNERRSALISAAVTGKIDIREHPSALMTAA